MTIERSQTIPCGKRTLVPFFVAAALLVSSVALPERASAQEETAAGSAKVTLARRFFDEGVEAVRGNQWQRAHEKFKKSYELAPRVLTLLNWAATQYQTKRYVEAAESYRRFLGQTSDGRYKDFRKDARDQLNLIEQKIGNLTVTATNLQPDDEVLIDGELFPPSALDEALAVNPGKHEVVVRRDGETVATESVEVAGGSAERVTIDAGAPSPPPDLRPKPPETPAEIEPNVLGNSTEKPVEEDASGSVLASPWLWAAVGVLAVGGGAAGYFLTRDTDPTAGTLGAVVEVP